MNRTIEDLLQQVEDRNRAQAITLWQDLQAYLSDAAGSTKSHHAWKGGYRDHVQEAMNLAVLLYGPLDQERKLSFTVSSALLVLFLHDCEKPFRHATDEQLSHFPWITARPTKSDKGFQERLLAEYKFVLSDDEQNALKYVEGENEDYVEGQRRQKPLAAFCHVCDTISARIWYDQPKT